METINVEPSKMTNDVKIDEEPKKVEGKVMTYAEIKKMKTKAICGGILIGAAFMGFVIGIAYIY